MNTKMRLKFGDESSVLARCAPPAGPEGTRTPQKLRTTSTRKGFGDDSYSQSQNAKAKVRIERDFCSDTGYK